MGKIASSLKASGNVLQQEKTASQSNQYTTIPVALETLSWPYHEPLALYRHLAHRFGDEAVYLLEAMDGPQRVARYGYLGFDPLLQVRFHGSALELSGNAKVTTLISERLADEGLVCQDGVRFHLKGQTKPWDVLRFIGKAFDITPRPCVGQFVFGWFGYFGYDAVRYIETLPERIPRTDESPDIELTLYRGVVCCDRTLEIVRVVVAHQPSLWPDSPMADAPEPSDETDATKSINMVLEIEADEICGTMRRDDYLAAVVIAKEHILRGDIYQIQIGHAIQVCSKISPLDVYRRLRIRNPSPFMYYAPVKGGYLIGASPELHVRVADSTVTMRPIAGTAPRGENAIDDQQSVEIMRQSEKEIAEHIMLVDLARNDLARICAPGSLRVDELMVTESYSHVHHLVSGVSAVLEEGRDIYDVMMATFPAGTMTGAPKVRAMEIIEDLEATQRGPYAGAVGLIDFGGFSEMALCIRSMIYQNGKYTLRASAGIVYDSLPVREWEETLHKMGAPFWAVTGKELSYACLAD